LPPPRCPAVTKNAGRSGKTARSRNRERGSNDDALARVVGCDIAKPFVCEEAHRFCDLRQRAFLRGR
jgi:hypothetical protein